MSYSSSIIADWLLARAGEDGEFLGIVKLTSLVYLANGWHLAASGGRPLVSDTFEACSHGPSLPVLRSRFASAGVWGIRERPEKPSLDDKTEGFLDAFWEFHRQFTGRALKELCVLKGGAWDVCWRGAGGQPSAMDNEALREAFKMPTNGKLYPLNGETS